jgi:DedD protein
MEEGSKRRLAGTAVVVLLLVIFVPMLLEEEAPSPVPEADLAVPPRPAFDEGLDRTLTEPPTETFVVPEPPAPPEEPEAVYGAPELPLPEVPYAPTPGAESGSADSASEPDPVAPPRETAKPKPPPAPEPAESPPPPAAPSPAAGGWVVQVAALAEQGRAESVARELRGKGFPAFVEKAVVGDKTYYRVRVGPELDRARTAAMADSLRRETGYAGQIRRHP